MSRWRREDRGEGAALAKQVDRRRTEIIRRRYNRNALFYDVMDRGIRPAWRERVLREARGRVLEVGVGTGKNLPHYDPAVTREVVGIDFSPAMLARARQRQAQAKVPVTLLEMDAQEMEFPADSFDTVLTTCVFCSVPDPILGLEEIRRVCKPGGRVLLLEHVRVDNPVIGPLMDLLNPVSVGLIGVNINRRTVENVRRAGLQIERVERLLGSLVLLIRARP